jgi:acyl-CoA-dependent ceramide synthase
LKYFGYETLCNIAFGIFLLTWFVARHIFYPIVCWSVHKSIPSQVPYGCYSRTTAEMLTTDGYPDRFAHLLSPYLSSTAPMCMNSTMKWTFLSLLLVLQVLSLIWFGMIVKIAVGVLRSGNAEDTRSDDEDEEDIETPDRSKERSRTPSTESSGSESSWRRSNGSVRTRRGRGGVLRDQSDRKALLGRIGCDKPT